MHSDFKAALAEARTREAHRRNRLASLDTANEREYTKRLLSGDLFRETTYGNGRPTKTKPAGKVIGVPNPTAAQLERHRRLFGSEGVELPDVNKSVTELRSDGLSVREISRVLGISERTAQTRLRAA